MSVKGTRGDGTRGEANHREAALRGVIAAAAFVIVIGGLKAAAPILVPVLLSAFLAIIVAAPYLWMQRKGVRTWAALLVLGAVLVAVGTIVGFVVQASLLHFRDNLGEYVAELERQRDAFVRWLRTTGLDVPEDFTFGEPDPEVLFEWAESTVGTLRALFTGAFIVAFTVLFMLLEAASFPAKIRAAHEDVNFPLDRYERVLSSVRRYLVIKTAISALTGILIYVFLLLLNVDGAALWAFIAFALNYIPNIGSLVASVPAVVLAFVQLGPQAAVYTAIAYFAANTFCGNLLEPRVMGRGVGLSPLVVFLSLLFWGWVFGPVGMFLSVPLTMTAKIAFESREETRWIAVLLGPEVAVTADVKTRP